MRIKTFIQVGITGVRFLLLKAIYRKNFNCTILNSCHRSLIIDIDKTGYLTIGNHLSSNRGLELSVRNGGLLEIGNNVSFNRNCLVVCRGKTRIGNEVIFGPGCKVYDHDHDYKKIKEERRKSTIVGNVSIGNGVWFGANCIVLKDTEIGDNCVFGAGSIIKGNYAADTLVVQKREEKSVKIEYV